MDVDFVQSVARVGDYVEVSLLTSATFEGILEELTLKRLILRRPDGAPVAVALATIATVIAKSAPLPGQPASVEETPPTPTPAPVPPAAPTPAASTPAASTPAAPTPVRISPAVMPATPAASAHRSASPVPSRDEAVAVAAGLSQLPVDFDVYVLPANRAQLHQIRESHAYAVKVNELDPRFGRINSHYDRAVRLWNDEQGNAELARLVGALALLKGDPEQARHYLSTAAEHGDVQAARLLAIAAAGLSDANTTIYALIRYFQATAPGDDGPAWAALLGLLDAWGGRGRLGVLLDAKHSGNDLAAVEAALAGTVPDRTPIQRPAGAAPRPTLAPVRHAPTATVAATAAPTNGGRRAGSSGGRSGPQRAFVNDDPYLNAKYLELQAKDLDAAKQAYRQAIKKNVRRESAVKDLAWLTRRVDGPVAALMVIEKEYAGMVQPGDTLDNILIDFLTGARRYGEALKVLDRQYQRSDLTTSKRYHLCYQIAYVKLANGQDATNEWRFLLDQSPDNPTAQRGLALALIRRGQPEELNEAELLIEAHTDEQAASIRRQIMALRQGLDNQVESADWLKSILDSGEPGQGESTPPLVTYVMQHYSDFAIRTKTDRKRENKPVTNRDLNVIAEAARQMSGKQLENSAQAYISAAVLAGEVGDRDIQRYLCLGLTTLADIVQDRQEHESARDLYCAALVAADEREDSDGAPDVRSALVAYLRSLNGRRPAHSRRREREESVPIVTEVAQVLADEHRTHGPRLFHLLTPLLADTSVARTVVLDALCSRRDLITAAAGYVDTESEPQAMRAGWQRLVDSWSRNRRRLTQGMRALHNLKLSEDVLDSAVSGLQANEQLVQEHQREGFTRMQEALSELRRYMYERTFEDRESRLRQAGMIVRQVREDIKRGPTSVDVECVEPLAASIQELVADAQKHLLDTQPPKPSLSLALEESSGGQNGVVTVQVKVANLAGRAPLESPQLIISADPESFTAEQPTIELPSGVRGGDHHIAAIRLRVTDMGERAGAFSLPVTLRYRRRSQDDVLTFEATLPVRLAQAGNFEEIWPNPFQDGATGVPVENPHMFFGRDDLINSIRAKLREATSPGVAVAIFGQKRAGKSSIRFHLKKRLEEEDHLPVVDIGNIGSLLPPGEENAAQAGILLLAKLMWRILKTAHATYSAMYPSDTVPPLIPDGLTRDEFHASPEPIYDCSQLIERQRGLATVPIAPLIVLIDEFQYFDGWIREELLPKSFLQAFKALIELRLFHLVIVGQDALDRLIEANSNIFGVFNSERVTYLAEAHARRLIVEPIWMQDMVSRYRERAVDQILELTGGSAYYIQQFCYKLVEYMNVERAPVVTEADVERVRADMLKQMQRDQFENLESPGYTDSEAYPREQYQQVLLAVARASRNQPATLSSIRSEYQGERLQELLDDLVLRNVVRRESGAYRIVVRLYQDWLLNNFGATSKARMP